MEGSKTLVLENGRKMIGYSFCDGRFECTDFYESEVNYRFKFMDKKSESVRIIWIEVGKFGRWDADDQKWYYRIQDNRHYVSADWFTFDNALESFQKQLESYII